MSRTKKFDIDPVDVDADGVCASQTPGGAGNLTINGALTSGGVYTSSDGGARQLSFTSASDESGDTYTVTGTDADGKAQTETVTGPNATTVESAKYFLTVTQIATSGAATGALTVGVVDELASATYRLDSLASAPALGQLDVTGTIDVTVQVSLADPTDTFADQNAIPWISSTNLAGKTADAIGALDHGATMARVLVNSFSSGAEVQAYISMPR